MSEDKSTTDRSARPQAPTGSDGHSFRPPTGPLAQDESPLPSHTMFILALIVGTFGGLGSIGFKTIIAFLHNVFFYGEIGLKYNPDAHIDPSPLGFMIILVPALGSLFVTWITNTVAPEARGHGVPEVLNAIYYERGRIRPMVVLAKALASAVSIGTGGSVGREGPIIQIGSAFGSTLGQVIRMPTRQRIVLVGAGAAAAIAATFNAPIGGLAFAVELLLVSISARTVALVAIATVTATYVGRLYSGLDPSFDVPQIANFQNHLVSLYSFLLCIPFGLLIGGASATFIRGLYWMEDGFERYFPNHYVRHFCGMLAVGVLMYTMLVAFNRYYVAGVGYSTIIDVLRGVITDPSLLLFLALAKLLATGLTLGSGASGGVFSPSLFMGATLGGAFGNLFAWIIPGSGVDPVVFAVAGMAGMISGTTGAVMTAITMMLEQTRDYTAIIPIITTVAIAYVVRVYFTAESIYTLKLVRRGATVPQGLQAAVSASHNARTMMSKNFQVVDTADIEEWQAGYQPGVGARYTVVTREGEVLGIARPELLYLLRDKGADSIVDKNVFFVSSSTPWPVIMRGLRVKDTDTALVTTNRRSRDGKQLIGVITSREVARTARESAELLE